MIDELRPKYTLNVLLSVSGLKRSTYAYYKPDKHLKAQRRKEEDERHILEIIRPVFEHHKGRYGSRRIKLACKELEDINHKKIERIMAKYGLKAIHKRKSKYKSYKGDDGISKENLLLKEEDGKLIRDFSTEAPNEKWTTDVSEFKSDEGKLYLSPILDLYDRSIIAYDISQVADFTQTKRMIDQAFEVYDDLSGLIFHSDQGWQYQMKTYRKWLIKKHIKQSFSRKGNCLDNSLMENFFGIMKNEMYYGHRFKTNEELKKAMDEYITYYNNERIDVKRKGLSPLAYRQKSFS